MGEAILKKIIDDASNLNNYADGPDYNDHSGDGDHTKG